LTTSAGGAGSIAVVAFTPSLNLPKADYVPVPKPVKSKYLLLMHYCPLWKEGTHYGWGKIEPWPERRPEIGWYDEGSPEVADWHIKTALEHGIQGAVYCWYRSSINGPVQQSLGHAIHDGLLKARYLSKIKFAIMWENGCGQGVGSAQDLMDNVLPFWLDNYFTHPSYLKIDGKPVLGMPGYPTSCLSNGYMLLVPLLQRLARLPIASLRTVVFPLGQRIVSTTGRHQFYTVRIVDGVAMPAFKASGDITSMSQADGYIEIPAQIDIVEKGEMVEVRLF